MIGVQSIKLGLHYYVDENVGGFGGVMEKECFGCFTPMSWSRCMWNERKSSLANFISSKECLVIWKQGLWWWVFMRFMSIEVNSEHFGIEIIYEDRFSSIVNFKIPSKRVYLSNTKLPSTSANVITRYYIVPPQMHFQGFPFTSKLHFCNKHFILPNVRSPLYVDLLNRVSPHKHIRHSDSIVYLHLRVSRVEAMSFCV